MSCLDEKCTVLVNSCDAYADLWDPFFLLFTKYWGDCPYPIVLNTETLQYNNDQLDIKCINYSDPNSTGYGYRIIKCLEKISTPFVILLLDDFFFRKKVDQAKLSQLLTWINVDSSITCFNLDEINDSYDKVSTEYPGFVQRSIFGKSRYNLQASLWRKESLSNAWKPRESPWQWEVYGNWRSWKSEIIIYALENINDSPFNYGKTGQLNWGVVRGKWVENDIVPFFKKENIKVNYSERGFFDKSQLTAKKTSKRDILYSVGILKFLQFSFWYFASKILYRIFKKNTIEMNEYSDWRNHYVKKIHRKS